MCLKNYITDSYGAVVYKRTLQLKKIRTESAKVKNQSIFLQRCVSHRLIPNSFKRRCSSNSQRMKQIIARCEFELLVCAKNDARRKYFKLLNEFDRMKDELSQILTTEDLTTILNATEKARENMFNASKLRLMNKFQLLRSRNSIANSVSETNHVKNAVLDLTNVPLPDNQKSLLELGPNFVPSTKQIPIMDIVSTTECSSLKLEYSDKVELAQTLRKDVLRVLKTSKSPSDNLSTAQRKAIKEIRDDNDIVIYPFDKGCGLVRISAEDANNKILEQIGNTKVIDEDPTPSFATKVRYTLCQMNKRKRFTKKEYEMIYPSDAIPPRMYGAIKAHKVEKGYPMRVIVSTIGTPVYGLSRYLVGITQPTLDKNEIRLKNTISFVNKAKTWNVSPEEVQVSFDVVNLYPSVPINRAISVMIDMLNSDVSLRDRTKLTIKEIKTLVELCLSRSYFLWNGKIYELENSGPIGLSLMVVLSEAFLQYLEKNAVTESLQCNPPIDLKSFYRYVDDSHARFPDFDQAGIFLTILNSQDENIQYTMEREDERKTLNFLSAKVINNLRGNYEFDIYRKNAITNIQVKPSSSHDPKVLDGIFKGFVHRALTLCSNSYIENELQFLVEVFVENGYNEKRLKCIITDMKRKLESSAIADNASNDNTDSQDNDSDSQTVTLPWIPGVSPKLRKVYKKAGYKAVFKSGASIKQLLTSKNKTQLPKNSNPGVYRIRCESRTCNPYVGETKLLICNRGHQHEECVNKGNTAQSALAVHRKKCAAAIKWDDIETLKIEPRKFERKVREALEIQRNQCGPKHGGMNLDDGQYVKTLFWTPLFKSLRNACGDEVRNERDSN